MKSDCECVRWTASPKHPQSITGLKITRASVTSVKSPTRQKVTTETILCAIPEISAQPVSVSTRARPTPAALAAGIAKSRCKNLKYSATMSDVPVGSMSFSIPATKKTSPTTTAAKRRIL